MKIPVWILSSFLGAWLLLQGWMLNSISNLNAEVAAIKAVLKTQTQLAKNNE